MLRPELLCAQGSLGRATVVSPAHAASADDLLEIRTLLESAGLPTSDLVSARPEFVAIREEGSLVAAGALQRFGSSALVRSVVVSHDRRGMGLGGTAIERSAAPADMQQSEEFRSLCPSSARCMAKGLADSA